MSFDRLTSAVWYYLDWYVEHGLALWTNLGPGGYIAVCCACVGVGWIFLKNNVKSLS